MASKQQMTGMRGVYLAAAELSRLGFIASPASRSAIGADILATDQLCRRAYSIQVKTNGTPMNFWLVGSKAKDIVSDSHVYVLVNLRSPKSKEPADYYVVPSSVMADKMVYSEGPRSKWYSFYLKDAATYKDGWSILGAPD